MKCNLCHKDKPLIKKSHIIPDFMYNGLFDENHFIAKLKIDELNVVGKSPDGIYDKRILCSECDNNIIGSYESYASKILFNQKLPEKLKPVFKFHHDPRGATRIHLMNIDYKKFKLFLLTLLWRGHISKQPFFESIDLGVYAELARKMILNGNPREESDFETLMLVYERDFLFAKSLVPCRKFRMENSICYLIHINSIGIIFRVSRGVELDYFEIGKIRKSNETNLYSVRGEFAKEIFEKTTGIKA